MSLIKELNRIIRERDYMSVDQIEAYCKEHRYKLSNAERRLRASESPNVEAVRDKGYIIGYRPRKSEVFAPKENINSSLREDPRTTFLRNFPAAREEKPKEKQESLL